MPEAYTVREATVDDIPTLLGFEQGVIAAERPFDPTLKREDTQYYDLPAMISAPHIRLLVSELDGAVVGSGYARIEQAKPFLRHKRYAYLGFMYVVPEQRGKGINKVIMQALESWATEQGVTELRLEVYYPNTPAIRAYEKAGFSQHMIEMRKGVD